jgi:transglutaminase-like putative cysteine protease
VSTAIALAGGVGQDPLAALPVPFPATSVTASGSLKVDKSTLMVSDSGVSLANLRYSVSSLDESPPAQALATAPPPAESIASRDLSVPSAYGPLRAVAASVIRAAGAKTPLAEAIALQNWLTGPTFKYTLTAPTVVSADGLAKFLEVTKAGYCQQFSFAMAVLARLLGIPSRVAYGFTSGTPVATDTWQVTTHDAHAWPELYFQGYGWLRFEPTPGGSAGQGTATSPSYSLTPVGPVGGASQATPGTGATSSPTGAQNKLRGITPPFPDGPAGTLTPTSATFSPWEIFGLVVAGLIALALPAPWCARRVIRYRRWRQGQRRTADAAGRQARADQAQASRAQASRAQASRAQAGRAQASQAQAGRARAGRSDRVRDQDVAWAHAAWQELRDDLADYGTATLPSESPRAVAARAGTGLALADPARAALGRIAMAEERARYAPAPADGAGLRADSAAVRRAIAAATPRRARWRARLLPASVVGPALSAVASAADLYRGSRGTRPFGSRGPKA